MQEDNAKQSKTRTGRLRGGEFGKATEAFVQKMGVHLYASRSSNQSGQEAGQNGTQNIRQPGARLLGRA